MVSAYLAATRVLDSMYTIASKPPVSLEVPPPELPMTHEILSRTLTPTLTPKTQHPPWTNTTKPPSEADEIHGFEDLIAVLNELSANGGAAPRFSTVFSLWRGRKPGAFETVSPAKFKAHLQLAESTGIIAIEQHQSGDWWITPRQRWDTDPDGPLHHVPPQHFGSPFHDLVQILNDLRLAGDPEPQLFIVGPRLLRKNPSIYQDVGVITFEEYVRAAAEAGVVMIRRGRNGDGSLKLCPAYCNPLAPSQTFIGTTSTPSIHVAGTTSPFAPLVDFLKSRRMTSGRPIPFSEVYSHLISTYHDPASLCIGVPGVTTIDQYIDAAVASGLVSEVEETTASGDVLVSFRVWLPDTPSPPAQPSESTTPPPSHHPSRETTAPSPSANVSSSSFQDLTAVLTDLRASTGEPSFRFSRIIPLLLERKPNAYASVGVTGFKDYVTLAMKNGVATAGWMDQDDGWVTSNDPEPAGPAVPLQSIGPYWSGLVTIPPPPIYPRGGGVDPQFVDLVETLGVMWKYGDETPLLSLVGTQLLRDERRRMKTLTACGVDRFKDYAELARDEGIIDIYHGWPGEDRVSLNPAIRASAGYI